MENPMQYVQNGLKSYMEKLDEYDETAKKDALKNYMKKLEQYLDMAGIKHIDIYELEDRVKEGIKYDYFDDMKIYDRKATREDEYDDMLAYMRQKDETFENTMNAEEKHEIVKKAIREAQDLVENERKESPKNMNQYLEEMLRAANKITGRYVVSQGYHNIDDFLSELSGVPFQVANDVGYEYDNMVKDTSDMAIDDFEGTLRDFSRSNGEKPVSNPQKDEFKKDGLYEKYLSEGPKKELNLGPQELDIKLCVIDLPKEKGDGSLQKGVAVSKSILDQAIEENNPNLTHDNESYVRVETKSFYFLVKEEEHEKAMNSRELVKKPKIEKEPVKPKKDPYEYTPML